MWVIGWRSTRGSGPGIDHTRPRVPPPSPARGHPLRGTPTSELWADVARRREARARGGGPADPGTYRRARRRAPRTRGWTFCLHVADNYLGREPRARGGGPEDTVTYRRDRRRAPRTRGWTGCPHVGGNAAGGEPRARGDGPAGRCAGVRQP